MPTDQPAPEDHIVEQKFFVRHLRVDDPRRARGWAYQVQLVDASGRATAVAHLGQGEESTELAGEALPEAVLSAARHLPAGESHFVDSEGRIIAPRDLLSRRD